MGVDKVRKEIIEYLYPLNQEETEALGNSMNIDRSIYMNGSGDVVRAEKLLEKGRVVALRPHTRLVTFPFHSHSYVELVYVAEGKMVHIINNKKIELKKGEILLVQPFFHPFAVFIFRGEENGLRFWIRRCRVFLSALSDICLLFCAHHDALCNL